ncbi:pyridoxine 5'-phosphate synthase [Aureimonas fodinaquatilis]|uniref:Pyridoxine 5'-phosphate synthase n=1 Tax=Aureimonas fodinaquatilis TaxID=2565783 RepID=A0A5B0E0U2_9HYPH|nr:pyridoxine 5'-phosphate synthase [Aureimonas fodinaquatilis]KAA0972248.1 pyridoxine 5'-phosphate synthase [Aureimonas fodinaquatilis]
MTVLSVNINAVAMLRNRRNLPWPSVSGIGRIALNAGAAGLTVHPRPDQRHIRFSDVPEIRAMIDAEFPGAEFNIEGYPTPDFLELALAGRADQVTLVPDDPAQPTSDHGWDFEADFDLLQRVVSQLKAENVRVSLFANPDPKGFELAAALGADRLELYTGPYGATHSDSAAAESALDDLERAGRAALDLGLALNAGHDLTVANLPPLVRRLPEIAEVSIGHALTADALEFGMGQAVARFLKALSLNGV